MHNTGGGYVIAPTKFGFMYNDGTDNDFILIGNDLFYRRNI